MLISIEHIFGDPGVMEKKFHRLADRKTLDSLLVSSKQRPVVIFKHSTACPISAAAYREMQKLENEVVLVEVQTAREVSRELANITGIRHESPQVIVFKDGKAVWNASHFDVNAREVRKALDAHG
jgi:bacillithiol system protein YtxJ